MKIQMIQLILLCSAILFSACATTGTSHEMSAKDEARYAQAIENAEADSPSPVQKNKEYTVVVGESAAQDLLGSASPSETPQPSHATPTNGTAAPKPEKKFTVSKADYDDFFAKSPAVVLGRMTLDPITDGGALLGYRVKEIKSFAGVDLVNEDIIVGINGKLPKNPDEYFNAWETCKKQSNCTVNIQRGVDRFNLEWKAE